MLTLVLNLLSFFVGGPSNQAIQFLGVPTMTDGQHEHLTSYNTLHPDTTTQSVIGSTNDYPFVPSPGQGKEGETITPLMEGGRRGSFDESNPVGFRFLLVL